MLQATISKQFAPGLESAGFRLDVQFEAAVGVTALYGPSGSGKTLTLDAIAGFVAPDAGRIMLGKGLGDGPAEGLGGRILFDAGAGVHLPPRLRNCGYVFQTYALFPHMTVRGNLAFAAAALPRLERHRRIAELLDRFQLTDLAGRYPAELSGGQKQRASIARALIAEPGLLLLDEPGRGLDPVLRADLHALILEIRKALRIPVLLVTHDLEECFAVADNLLLYREGKIVARGAPTDLLRHPGNTAVASLLGSFNLYPAEILTLDPAAQTSRIRLLGQELNGPHLRGVFRGDRIVLCARPEELKLAGASGTNRIRIDAARAAQGRITERLQSIRADFGDGLVLDIPREVWSNKPDALWIEIPQGCLRQLREEA